MVEEISLAFGFVSLALGVMLLYSASNADVAWVLSGAALLSLGMIIVCLVVKSKLEWRRHYKIRRIARSRVDRI